jgi:hypothetical protein
MPDFTKDDVSRAFLAKLYAKLTTLPDVEANPNTLPNDTFIAWCSPGIPFTDRSFDFATHGIGGGTGEGEAVRQRIQFADDWARLVNFLPDPNGIYDQNGMRKLFDNTAFTQDGASMASVYHNVLRFSEVASGELDPETQARLEHFRSLLTQVTHEQDLFTGEMVERVADSPVVTKYYELMGDYLTKARLYNSKRLNALNSADAAAVQDFALHAEDYRMEVRAALGKWESQGRKSDIEKMRAWIQQVTMRDLVLLKQELLDNMERARITNALSGLPFYWTSLIPADLASSDGWTEYTFSHTETDEHREKHTNAWSVNIGVSYGWFRGSGGVNGSMERDERTVNTANFKMQFEVAEAIITRPWCGMEFLLSEAWRFAPTMPNLTHMTQTLSNGERPPAGSLIAVPSTAIFARKVGVDFDELHDTASRYVRDIAANAGLSIGPVNLGGSYKRHDEEEDMHREQTAEGLKVPGMQLIGFKCRLLPKLPHPSPNVLIWR